jgi:hypothetical protein
MSRSSFVFNLLPHWSSFAAKLILQKRSIRNCKKFLNVATRFVSPVSFVKGIRNSVIGEEKKFRTTGFYSQFLFGCPSNVIKEKG